jgi:hypothetical protein
LKKPNHSILDLPANDHKEFKSHWKFESNMMILSSLLPPQLEHTIHPSIGDRKLSQICDNLTCHVSMQIPKTASCLNLNFDTRKAMVCTGFLGFGKCMFGSPVIVTCIVT